MFFEFNPQKSVANEEKHGINFQQAQELWLDPRYVEIPAKSEDEPRYAIIGKIDTKCWTAFITYRNKHIRLISVRRSRKEEELLYES
jgi:uncharacterized protein